MARCFVELQTPSERLCSKKAPKTDFALITDTVFRLHCSSTTILRALNISCIHDNLYSATRIASSHTTPTAQRVQLPKHNNVSLYSLPVVVSSHHAQSAVTCAIPSLAMDTVAHTDRAAQVGVWLRGLPGVRRRRHTCVHLLPPTAGDLHGQR